MLRRAFAALFALLSLTFAAAEEGTSLTEARTQVLRLLHDGRFDEAEEALRDGGALPPGPDRDFLRAFVLYWRLLYDSENADLKAGFNSRLDAALASAGARLAEAPRDAEALLWSGTAHLFLAELRASEKRPIAAAMEARRARHALSESYGVDSGMADALFGLGTVDVLAAELPGLAKGLGAFLGLSGDRGRGIASLERAASEGRTFSLEARLFLLGIRSSRKKRIYGGALAEADLVAEAAPRSVVALDGAARVRIALGDAARAAGELDAALALAAASPRTDRTVLANLLVRRAAADLSMFRPDLAFSWLHRLLPLRSAISRETRKDGAEIARSAASATAAPPWYPELAAALGLGAAPSAPAGSEPDPWMKAIPALDLERAGEPARAADQLEALASESPDEPFFAMLAGRAALLAGRTETARALLSRAGASARLPKAWLGPCLLLEGRAADLAGERTAALALYRRAADAPWFADKEAAWFHLTVPYRGAS